MYGKFSGHAYILGDHKKRMNHVAFMDLIAFIKSQWAAFEIDSWGNKHYSLYFHISKCDFKQYMYEINILLNKKYQIRSLYLRKYYTDKGYYYSIPKSKKEEMIPLFKSICPLLMLTGL